MHRSQCFLKNVFCVSLLACTACGQGSQFLSKTGSCGGYGTPSASAYVLPYETGEKFLLSQGNCSMFTHKGSGQYAFDFIMPIGTNIVAVRAGTVTAVEESFADNNGGTDANYVIVRHEDGTVAQYLHLTQEGALVSIGDAVTQGQVIAISGNTGQSTAPHLHFDVRKSEADMTSIPIVFRNANPSDLPTLREGAEYIAQ